ncbi:hypothetical protein [Streptomyces sp. NPDC018045]|uniref:hypothetical protein n=1 Tax=Streptomyces sp. NPDC018045 TaxID=3365037 RepID=UPI0037AB4FAB
MKLRRALAAVTATAAMLPAALSAAPAAYATGTPEPAPTATASATATPSATPTSTPGPECQDWSSERAVKAELRGLPGTIVAGSGWVGFTYRATNVTAGHLLSVQAAAQIYALENETTEDISGHLTLEWFDAAAGRWRPVAGPEEGDGYFASVAGADGLGPGEYAEAELRLKADARTPAGHGGAVSVGWYLNADLTCGYSDAVDHPFTLLPAGRSKPGHVPDAR